MNIKFTREEVEEIYEVLKACERVLDAISGLFNLLDAPKHPLYSKVRDLRLRLKEVLK